MLCSKPLRVVIGMIAVALLMLALFMAYRMFAVAGTNYIDPGDRRWSTWENTYTIRVALSVMGHNSRVSLTGGSDGPMVGCRHRRTTRQGIHGTILTRF